MSIIEAQKQAEILLGKNAIVKYDWQLREFKVGIAVAGEFIIYGVSTESWEKALEEAKRIRYGKA